MGKIAYSRDWQTMAHGANLAHHIKNDLWGYRNATHILSMTGKGCMTYKVQNIYSLFLYRKILLASDIKGCHKIKIIKSK